MRRTFILSAIFVICQVSAFGQKKYEMVVEKTDGTEITVNVEDIVRTFFRERTDGAGNDDAGETTCPDSNHPHWIDLGLPSGTKWACCNVGASAPEQYGDYYAWGETSPKSVYNEVSYSYFTGQDTDGDGWIDTNFSVVNIGSDIAGTQYDAATANWGSPWCMPSLAQIKELKESCTSTWTTQNGVNGRKFVGPNGGAVFLPAAGYRWDGEVYYAGSYGYYWSSTLNESNPSNAYYPYFHSGVAYWSNGPRRFSGHTVRPVR